MRNRPTASYPFWTGVCGTLVLVGSGVGVIVGTGVLVAVGSGVVNRNGAYGVSVGDGVAVGSAVTDGRVAVTTTGVQ